MGMASLLNQVVNGTVSMEGRRDVAVAGERFGCSAFSEREKRACSLYLWLLGPTTEQLVTRCPCRG